MRVVDARIVALAKPVVLDASNRAGADSIAGVVEGVTDLDGGHVWIVRAASWPIGTIRPRGTVRLSTHQLTAMRGAVLDPNAFGSVLPHTIVDLIDEVIESRETIADMIKALRDAGVEIRVRGGAP